MKDQCDGEIIAGPGLYCRFSPFIGTSTFEDNIGLWSDTIKGFIRY